jgi:hypothetical protein
MSEERKRDPLRGMKPATRTYYESLPDRVQGAYLRFFLEREDRKGAHRDQLPAFVAGYYSVGKRRFA